MTSMPIRAIDRVSAEMPDRDIVRTSDTLMSRTPTASRISRLASVEESHRILWRQPDLTSRIARSRPAQTRPSDSGKAISIHPAK